MARHANTGSTAEIAGGAEVAAAGENAVTASVPAARVERTQLPNGLVICTEYVPGVRSVALGVWVRSASVHESREQMGVSHLLEHLVFKGTARRTARDIAVALESRGGALDAYTSRENTAFQAHILDRDLPLAIDLLHDLLFSPLLRDEDLALERQVVLDEIALVDDTPDDLVFEEHNALMWGAHPYGYTILGTRESVGALTGSALRAQHARAFVPSNMVMSAAGNVDHQHVVSLVESAGWGAPGASRPVVAVPPPQMAPVATKHIVRDLQQSHIVFGSTTIPMADPTRPAFLIVSTLLGGGMSSRLFQHVRERLGLAYAVYGFHSLNSDIGMHGVYVGTAPETTSKARTAVDDELKRLTDEGVPEDELELGRQQLLGQYLLSLESPGARMQRAASCELVGEPFRTVEEVTRRIESVTRDDALAVARAWFAPERHSVVVLGPKQSDD
ncbi:MAG TPA: pitrilysin family protein [Gemmatimonadaceae bacterium]|nr:pitrilysin family protein [Gemmatimonadaceae bacterium]